MQRLKPRYPKLIRNHRQARGLVVGYPFHEGAGTRLTDAVIGGQNNLTTVTGTPAWVSGAFGPALSFNGSSIIANGGNTKNLPGGATQAFTFGAWIKTSTYTSLSCPFAWGNQPATELGTGDIRGLLQFNNGAGNNYYFWGANADWDSGVLFDVDGKWHRIVFAANSTTIFLFRDGKQVASGTRPAGLVNLASKYVTLASKHPSAAADFTGVLDDFFVANRAWSLPDVIADYFDPFAIYRRSLYQVGVAAGGTSLTFPSAAWLWKGNAPLDTLALTQAQKSWVWSPHPPTDALAVTAAQKPWRWNGQAPSLTLAQTAAQKGWAWAKQAPALSFALGTIGKIWNWAASAATFAGGNFSAVSIIVRYIGPVWKRRRSVPVEQ